MVNKDSQQIMRADGKPKVRLEKTGEIKDVIKLFNLCSCRTASTIFRTRSQQTPVFSADLMRPKQRHVHKCPIIIKEKGKNALFKKKKKIACECVCVLHSEMTNRWPLNSRLGLPAVMCHS